MLICSPSLHPGRKPGSPSGLSSLLCHSCQGAVVEASAFAGEMHFCSVALNNVASYGYYWSSCQYSSSSYYGQGLDTYGASLFYPTYDYGRAYGFTVRCVRLQN